MKLRRITFFCCCIILLASVAAGCGDNKTEYLRIHIRANSDSCTDQRIKYEIRDKVVVTLTPVIENCDSLQSAITAIENSKVAVNRLIDGFLSENGFAYGSNVCVRREKFPTRVYDGVTLPEGEYWAVIIELGSAAGANWWCVVYPPLCFSKDKSVVYRSIFSDILNRGRQQPVRV